MKCDELKVHKAYNRWIDEEMPTPNDDLICNEVYLKDEVDAAIAELKQKLQDQCISCPVKMQEDDVVAEFKQKLEDAKATAYAESVDAGMENRRLKRALWIARAKIAKAMKATDNLNNYLSIHKNSKWFGIYATRIDTWYYKWDDVERKCRAKAEEYK